jgi:hypothetical protein
MRAAKNSRKTKGARPRKKGGKARLWWGIVLCCVLLSALFVIRVFGPPDVAIPPKIARLGPAAPPAGEATPAPKPATGKSPAAKDRAAPGRRANGLDAALPVVAIVIDDMGYSEKTCEALLDLDFNLSFAFLPFGPHTMKQAYRANRLGRDVLLHFPMEATDAKWHPGRGVVTTAMEAPEIRRIFSENLASVPYAVGTNNHMGSSFTRNDRAMRIFLAATRQKGLYFLDSRTAGDSLGYSLAGEMGLKAAKRDIFLDNVRDPQKIIGQLRKLLEVARQRGEAVAIGHPYPETLQALREYRGEILRRAKVVGVGSLAR